MIISAIMVYRYPITEKVFDEILELLNKKRNGETDIDTSRVFKICRIRGK